MGDGLIAAIRQDVDDRLGADDLRGRRDQRRISEIFAYPRDLFQHRRHALQCVLLFELIGEIGDHAARDLIDLDARIDAGEVAFELMIALAYLIEIHADCLDRFQVQAGVVFGAAQSRDQALGGRMGGAAGHGGDGRIDGIAAVFDRLEMAHIGQTGGGMRMQVQRQIDRIFQRLYQLGGHIGGEQPGHILERDGVAAHGRQLAAHGDESGDIVHRALRIADGALGMLAGSLGGLDRGLDVAQVV